MRTVERLLSGLEAELLLLNEKGRPVGKADDLLKGARSLKKDIQLMPECGLNMIEIGAYPHASVPSVVANLIDNIEEIAIFCEDAGLYLMPLGTYPG
ncbi:MAG: hypothetical protein ABIH34_05190, partial [Nanoarchaeota archaeon]